jgi:hypothetical protein
MTGPLQFPHVRSCYKVGKSCVVLLFHKRHLATLFVRNATGLPTQHVVICEVLVENYATCNNVTEVLDISKLSTVMFFT